MSSSKVIEHSGFISAIQGNVLKVSIIAQSACSACHAKGACSAADTQEKFIDVVDSLGKYNVGDLVTVQSNESLGVKALFLGYLVPFFVLFISLIVAKSLNFSDGKAGVFALGSLVPYYLVLFLFKHKLQKTFTFSLKK